jgi:polar amino acid transport system ATP-binding protein
VTDRPQSRAASTSPLAGRWRRCPEPGVVQQLALGAPPGEAGASEEQQRVAIIRALATRPRALLLDEITSALDPELVGEVLAVVRELKEEGMTMLIATHEMGFARDVADEVCFLNEGRIAERGTPERVLSEPDQPETQRFLRRLLEAGRL